jgi:aldehyde dehydrogenase (NAD+)
MHNQLFINNEVQTRLQTFTIRLLTSEPQYVDAKSGETITIHSPHNESLVADNIQVAGQADVDAAAAAARAAFKGEWSRWTPAQRTKAMNKLADLIDEKTEELALWESKCMGQPIEIAKLVTGLASAGIRCRSPSRNVERWWLM